MPQTHSTLQHMGGMSYGISSIGNFPLCSTQIQSYFLTETFPDQVP